MSHACIQYYYYNSALIHVNVNVHSLELPLINLLKILLL